MRIDGMPIRTTTNPCSEELEIDTCQLPLRRMNKHGKTSPVRRRKVNASSSEEGRKKAKPRRSCGDDDDDHDDYDFDHADEDEFFEATLRRLKEIAGEDILVAQSAATKRNEKKPPPLRLLASNNNNNKNNDLDYDSDDSMSENMSECGGASSPSRDKKIKKIRSKKELNELRNSKSTTSASASASSSSDRFSFFFFFFFSFSRRRFTQRQIVILNVSGTIILAITLLFLAGIAYQQIGLRMDEESVYPRPPDNEMFDLMAIKRSASASPSSALLRSDASSAHHHHHHHHYMHLHCEGGEMAPQGRRSAPNATTIVLEAGLPMTSISWNLVQDLLVQKHSNLRVCSYDRSGYGWSEPGPTPRDSNQMVKELHDLLEMASAGSGGESGGGYINGPPYILVAHSFGGFIARGYAYAYPSEVSGMVLVDSTHEDQIEELRGFMDQLRLGMRSFNLARTLLAPLGVMRLAAAMGQLPAEAGYVVLWEEDQHTTNATNANANANANADDDDDDDRHLATLRRMRAQTNAVLSRSEFAETAYLELESFVASAQSLKIKNNNNNNNNNNGTNSSSSSPPLGSLPLVVLTAGLEDDPEWFALQEKLVALSNRSEHIYAGDSDHFIMYHQPEKIVEAVEVLLKMMSWSP